MAPERADPSANRPEELLFHYRLEDDLPLNSAAQRNLEHLGGVGGSPGSGGPGRLRLH